jgi:hypothetical protein
MQKQYPSHAVMVKKVVIVMRGNLPECEAYLTGLKKTRHFGRKGTTHFSIVKL